MEGTVPGVRKQGRPKMRWMVDMEKWAKMLFEKLLKETEDRWRWCYGHEGKEHRALLLRE